MVAPGLPRNTPQETSMDSVKLSHKDGRERVVTTPAERVAARFDGFVEKSAGQRAAATRKANAAKGPKAPRKAAATKKTTSVSPTEAKKGAPPADNASANPAPKPTV
jgi:hypothetical protein